MSEVKIASRETLKGATGVKTEIVALPELGEGVFVKVRGYTIGDRLAIQEASLFEQPDGRQKHSVRNDILYSIICALEEPRLSVEDTAWILDLPDGVRERIIGTALRLSLMTVDSYEEFKDKLSQNPYIRRIYSVCVNKLGRLPSELSDVPESEFIAALAALELDAEDEEEELEKELAKARSN